MQALQEDAYPPGRGGISWKMQTFLKVADSPGKMKSGGGGLFREMKFGSAEVNFRR